MKKLMQSRNSHDQGMALITVVWIILILSLLAAGIMAATLTARKTVASIEQNYIDQQLAKSAISIFMNQHYKKTVENQTDKASFKIKDSTAHVSVQYEAGKINVNWQDLATISALFASKGVDENKAVTIASAIIDWRDPDNIPLEYGVERAAYLGAEIPILPRNGAYETLGEIRHVLGMTDTIYLCVKPLITVSSIKNARSGFVEAGYASDAVKEVFSWAQQRSWFNREWKLKDISSSKAALRARTITLFMNFEHDLDKVYKQIIRIKNIADTSRAFYKTLTPLTVDYISDKNVCSLDQ